MHSQEFADLTKLHRTDLLLTALVAFAAGVVSTLAVLVLP